MKKHSQIRRESGGMCQEWLLMISHYKQFIKPSLWGWLTDSTFTHEKQFHSVRVEVTLMLRD